MALYSVDMRDGVVVRASEEHNGLSSEGIFLIEAASAKQALAKVMRSSLTNGSVACESCHHRYCTDCEHCSVAKQSSDYWICHRCGELNRRVLKCI